MMGAMREVHNTTARPMTVGPHRIPSGGMAEFDSLDGIDVPVGAYVRDVGAKSGEYVSTAWVAETPPAPETPDDDEAGDKPADKPAPRRR